MKTCIIKKEYLNPGEPQLTMLIVVDNGDRLQIKPLHWKRGFAPIETVSREMVIINEGEIEENNEN